MSVGERNKNHATCRDGSRHGAYTVKFSNTLATKFRTSRAGIKTRPAAAPAARTLGVSSHGQVTIA